MKNLTEKKLDLLRGLVGFVYYGSTCSYFTISETENNMGEPVFSLKEIYGHKLRENGEIVSVGVGRLFGIDSITERSLIVNIPGINGYSSEKLYLQDFRKPEQFIAKEKTA